MNEKTEQNKMLQKGQQNYTEQQNWPLCVGQLWSITYSLFLLYVDIERGGMHLARLHIHQQQIHLKCYVCNLRSKKTKSNNNNYK